MDQGLVTVEADGFVSICNRRVLELLNFPVELMAARPHTGEVLALQLSRGEFAGASDSICNLLKPNIREEFSYLYERMDTMERF